jgi:hypothetical protein
VRARQVTAIDELELSSRDADDSSVDVELPSPSAELSIVSELLPPLLSEEISSLSGPLALALLLSSQAISVKASVAAAIPQAILMKFFFMVFPLFSASNQFQRNPS